VALRALRRKPNTRLHLPARGGASRRVASRLSRGAARNEAPGLGADTVQALDGPEDGVQRYAMWRCGR